MTTFDVNRNRPRYANYVYGTIVDPDDSHSRVTFETAGSRHLDSTPAPPTVNWSAHGSVSPADARRYAQQILVAADEAELAPRDFEPDDAVTLDDLPEERKARIRSYDEVNGPIVVQDFIPGKDWEETARVTSIDLEDVDDCGLRRLTLEEVQAEEAEMRREIAEREGKS